MPSTTAISAVEVFWSMMYAIFMVLFFAGWMRIVLEGFRNNLMEGVLCQFVPFYDLYFVFIKEERAGGGEDIWFLRLLWLFRLPMVVALIVILSIPYKDALEPGNNLAIAMGAMTFVVFIVGLVMAAMRGKKEEAVEAEA